MAFTRNQLASMTDASLAEAQLNYHDLDLRKYALEQAMRSGALENLLIEAEDIYQWLKSGRVQLRPVA